MSYAPPVDVAAHGSYGPGRAEAARAAGRPVYPFQGRIGSPEFPAVSGRYHLYASWTCPFAGRAVAVLDLAGLRDVVGLSYVDDERDGLGWAFRERRGADPVNGFRYLSEAYDATEPGYAGHYSVPVLWDTETRRIVSNHSTLLTLDLATAFADHAEPTDPDRLRAEVASLTADLHAEFPAATSAR
ncbi:hypothetical protein LO762_11675 [Actinocorallia sp. API 0066]|uniref:hypothetical protein n=1 Tax=Actinocorallia sp. API 0066 TaxID=2896846 RepID=UPI001E416531|nr:hypothetical protein [Actinocorallia sp. API 0066]MCD0449842.1 hypothetical protein [Actinocorallia sp. API 0066]